MSNAAQRVYNENEIGTILRSKCEEWNIGETSSSWDIRDELIDLGHLETIDLPFRQTPRKFYVWGRVSLLEAISGVDRKGYYSHHAAAYLHGLTSLPPTLYFNIEQRAGSSSTGQLSHKNIDAAFRKPARLSTNSLDFDDFAVCLISGRNTQNLGVETMSWQDASGREIEINATNLERTLIDLAVRPICSGGPHEVLRAFREAGKEADISKLLDLLLRIAHLYPYHQSIGFYMDRSGAYDSEQLALLKGIPMSFDFYLANEMPDTQYDAEWRIHVPADL